MLKFRRRDKTGVALRPPGEWTAGRSGAVNVSSGRSWLVNTLLLWPTEDWMELEAALPKGMLGMVFGWWRREVLYPVLHSSNLFSTQPTRSFFLSELGPIFPPFKTLQQLLLSLWKESLGPWSLGDWALHTLPPSPLGSSLSVLFSFPAPPPLSTSPSLSVNAPRSAISNWPLQAHLKRHVSNRSVVICSLQSYMSL